MQANDLNKLFHTLKKEGAEAAAGERDVTNAVQSLSASQQAKLNDILSSPDKMKALLSSDAAKDLLQKLGKQGT